MSVALWAVRIERPLTEEESQVLMELLPAARRERLLRIQKTAHRRDPMCAYLLLRRALFEWYGWRELPPIAYSERGKPWFPDFPTVQFNLSHTDGAALVGLSKSPIGVDIERIRPVSQHTMQRLAAVATKQAFFQSWVRREARAKLTGAGIGAALGAETFLKPGEYFHYMETFPGYVAGAASLEDTEPDIVGTYGLEELMQVSLQKI